MKSTFSNSKRFQSCSWLMIQHYFISGHSDVVIEASSLWQLFFSCCCFVYLFKFILSFQIQLVFTAITVCLCVWDHCHAEKRKKRKNNNYFPIKFTHRKHFLFVCLFYSLLAKLIFDRLWYKWIHVSKLFF